MDSVERFLEESPIARRVALPAQVIVGRFTLSPQEVAHIVESGSFSPTEGAICELEVGDQCVARGKIVRRWGKRSYFKILEVHRGGAE